MSSLRISIHFAYNNIGISLWPFRLNKNASSIYEYKYFQASAISKPTEQYNLLFRAWMFDKVQVNYWLKSLQENTEYDQCFAMRL